jgi:hypothetical protein
MKIQSILISFTLSLLLLSCGVLRKKKEHISYKEGIQITDSFKQFPISTSYTRIGKITKTDSLTNRLVATRKYKIKVVHRGFSKVKKCITKFYDENGNVINKGVFRSSGPHLDLYDF